MWGYNPGSADYPAVFMRRIIATTQWTGGGKEGGEGQEIFIYIIAIFWIEYIFFFICKCEPVLEGSQQFTLSIVSDSEQQGPSAKTSLYKNKTDRVS